MPFAWYHPYLYMMPYIPVCLLFLWILRKAYRIKPTSVTIEKGFLNSELQKMGSITTNEKKAAVSLIFLAVFLVTSTWHGVAILYGFMASVVYLFLSGIRVGTKQAVEKVSMATIAFVVACMSIGVVGTAVGFDQMTAELMGELLSGKGDYIALYTLFGAGAVANFVMTPLAILASLLNPVVQIAAELGINPLGAIYSLFASIDFYILPYENAWALVFFGLGMMSFRDFIKLNLLRSSLLAAALGLLLTPWWSLFELI